MRARQQHKYVGCFVTGQYGIGQRDELGGGGTESGEDSVPGGTKSGHQDLNPGSQSPNTTRAAQPLPSNYPLSLENSGEDGIASVNFILDRWLSPSFFSLDGGGREGVKGDASN